MEVKRKIIEITKILPNPDNPRTIKKAQFEKLKKSIIDFPEMIGLRPIVVDDAMMILGGNMRLRALQSLGYKKVEVLIAEGLTPEQKKEFIIKDNVSFGDWDNDILANVWEVEALNDWGLHTPGGASAFNTGDDFSDLDKQNEDLNGLQDYSISITIPEKHREAIEAYLLNGETVNTDVGRGRGVMRLCGLL